MGSGSCMGSETGAVVARGADCDIAEIVIISTHYFSGSATQVATHAIGDATCSIRQLSAAVPILWCDTDYKTSTVITKTTGWVIVAVYFALACGSGDR